jgi:XTP/dITP diphosphohydrolase
LNKDSLGFITSNNNKFKEAQRILSAYKIDVKLIKVDLLEVQDDELENVSRFTLEYAKKKFIGKIMVEDSGLFIEDLKGFPGPYSAYIYRRIGCEGILKLLFNINNRYAEFRSAISFTNTNTDMEIKTFTGVVEGQISKEKRGREGFGYDPIFIPEKSENTFAEMDLDDKNRYSHRGLSLKKFAEWYVFNLKK